MPLSLPSKRRPGIGVKEVLTGISPNQPGTRVGERAIRESVENGGFTQTPQGVPATTGYSVGQKGTTGVTRADTAMNPNGKVSIHAFNDLDSWRDRHRGAIYAAGHMGGWNNPETGNIVFNATKVLHDRGDAIHQGGPSEQDQISVFHLDKFDEIPTGGKGDEERNYPRVTESKRAKKQFPVE